MNFNLKCFCFFRCYHRDESRLATVNSKINFGNTASYLLPESQPEFEANSETNSVTSESAEQLTGKFYFEKYFKSVISMRN